MAESQPVAAIRPGALRPPEPGAGGRRSGLSCQWPGAHSRPSVRFQQVVVPPAPLICTACEDHEERPCRASTLPFSRRTGSATGLGAPLKVPLPPIRAGTERPPPRTWSSIGGKRASAARACSVRRRGDSAASADGCSRCSHLGRLGRLSTETLAYVEFRVEHATKDLRLGLVDVGRSALVDVSTMSSSMMSS